MPPGQGKGFELKSCALALGRTLLHRYNQIGHSITELSSHGFPFRHRSASVLLVDDVKLVFTSEARQKRCPLKYGVKKYVKEWYIKSSPRNPHGQSDRPKPIRRRS